MLLCRSSDNVIEEECIDLKRRQVKEDLEIRHFRIHLVISTRRYSNKVGIPGKE
jgi:hypothetical protein